MKKLDYNEIKYLQSKKFIVEFLDDLSGFWMTKQIKTKIFGLVTINIDDVNSGLYIWCEKEDDDYGFTDFIKKKYSRKSLKKVLKLLKNN